MSRCSELSHEHCACLAQADAIADELVAAWPSAADPSTLVFECPQGWDRLLSVLDMEGAEQRYRELFQALQTADELEQRSELVLEWDETVGRRLALWLEAQSIFYRALVRANRRW